MEYGVIGLSRDEAIESFRANSLDVVLRRGMSMFVVLRGQWNLLDVFWQCVAQTQGEVRASFWPRLVAVSKGDYLQRFLDEPRISFCRLVLNTGDERVNTPLVAQWQQRFGAAALVHTKTHAKIATFEADGWQCVLRGSMNLGHGSRFEQCDITEGGPEFAYVRAFEAALPEVGAPGLRLHRKPVAACLPTGHETARSMFLLSAGAYDFVDMLCHYIHELGKDVRLYLWTWVAAARDIARLAGEGGLTQALLFIDMDARERVRNNPAFREQWTARFGAESIRYVVSHAKMAVLFSTERLVCIRGSANANRNASCEQFDVTIDGPDGVLLQRLSEAYPVLADDIDRQSVARASQVGGRLQAAEHAAFAGIRPWVF